MMHLLTLGLALYFYPVSWDEGWTFCAARHLLEDAHYGCLYNGNFTPTRLTTSMATVLMAYTGFSLLGVSYLSGRLLFALQTLLLVAILSRIARRAWGERAELMTLACLLTLSSDPKVHPLFVGAQAWGEAPALLALLVGILLLQPWVLPTLQPSNPLRFAIALPCLLLSAIIKVQFRPFIAAAFVSSGAVLLLRRTTRSFGLICILLGLATWVVATRLPTLPLPVQKPLDLTGVVDMGYWIVFRVAAVTDPRVRAWVVDWLVTHQGPLLILLLATLFLRQGDKRSLWISSAAHLSPLVAFSFVVLLWFATLATTLTRYAAPALICAAAPVALVILALLKKPSDESLSQVRLPFRVPPSLRGPLIAALLLVGISNYVDVCKSFIAFNSTNKDLSRTAAFLNAHAETGDVVETYDTNLFYLLNVPYVYPPDDYHILTPSERALARSKWPSHAARFIVLGTWSRIYPIVEGTPEGYEERVSFGEFTILERRRSA